MGSEPAPAYCLAYAAVPSEALQRRLPTWNAWADAQYFDITDRRYDLDVNGHTSSMTLGADRRLANGLILGFSINAQDSKVDSFQRLMKIKTTAFSLGPYVAREVSARWMIDGSVTFGWAENHQDLLVLAGAFDSQTVAASAGLTGQYSWRRASLRPSVRLNYSHTSSDSYALRGAVGGLELNVKQGGSSSDFGTVQVSAEINRVFVVGRTPVMPYAEAEIEYAFERPNDGDLLTGDLSQARPSAVSGTPRAGVRAMLSPTTTLTIAGGRGGLGQNGLQIWDLRLYASRSF